MVIGLNVQAIKGPLNTPHVWSGLKWKMQRLTRSKAHSLLCCRLTFHLGFLDFCSRCTLLELVLILKAETIHDSVHFLDHLVKSTKLSVVMSLSSMCS